MPQTSHETIRLAQVLFEPADLVELRLIETWDGKTNEKTGKPKKESKLRHQAWIAAGELQQKLGDIARFNASPTWANAFFGVCPRIGTGKGDKNAVRTVRCVWADLDHCDVGEAGQRVEQARLPHPTIIVSSGHGAHMYWKFEQPFIIDSDVARARIEAMNQEISILLGGDHTQDVCRILRLPGFPNVKNARNGATPTPCVLDTFEPEATIEGFDEMILRLGEQAQLRIDAIVEGAEGPRGRGGKGRGAASPSPQARRGNSTLSDERILELCNQATNSAKFQRLWAGQWEGHEESHSHADMALCCILAFYTKDPGQIDALFRRSTLMRPKWDEMRGAKAYGVGTIDNALRTVTEQYRPPSGYERPPLFEPDFAVGQAAAGERRRDAGAITTTSDEAGIPGYQFPPPPAIGPAPMNRDPDSYAHTDTGNAERFIDTHGDNLRFSEALDMVLWSGNVWQVRSRPKAHGLAIKTVRAMLAEVEKLKKEKDTDRADALKKWMRKSEGAPRLNAILDVSRGVAANRDLYVTDADKVFDTHPMLLNVVNGTIDLATGRLHKPVREAYLTMMATIHYDPAARCPRWMKFIHEIFRGDEELIAYIQRVAGYCLTGSTREHKWFFFWGDGNNGKSTWIQILQRIMGDYSMSVPSETFMVQAHSQIPNDVARMRGKRLVAAKETEEGKQLAESRIKELTGDDEISARFMRAEWFDFRPQCKLIICGQHKPKIKGTDKGTWRRIHMVPFTMNVPDSQIDQTLPQKLMAENTGILNWLLEGAKQWLRVGLQPPSSVLAATQQYREDSDMVGRFIEEWCDVGDLCQEEGGRLYIGYQAWVKARGEYILNNQRFAAELERRGFVRDRSTGKSIWDRISLKREACDAVQTIGYSPRRSIYN